MLYQLFDMLGEYWSPLNVFRYVTVRAAFAALTSFFIVVLSGSRVINLLRHLCHPNMLSFRKDKKEDVPTMGGLLIIGSLLFSVFLWNDLGNTYIILLTCLTLWLCGLGFWDDYVKLRQKTHKGLRPMVKIAGQLVAGLLAGAVLYYHAGLNFDTGIYVPFFKEVVVPLGFYYIFFAAFIIIGTSNAVNLTDGVDGLAIGTVLMVALAYGVISYVSGHINFAEYLNIPYIRGTGEVTIFSGALAGASLGFLWFNAYPAQIFMGDTGSLTLGGLIGLLAIIVKQELSLIIVGGIFVIEAASVIIQVFSFKTRKKRVFLMTPIHHHFELKGVPESKVVVRFWIAGIILALFTLVTLKIR